MLESLLRPEIDSIVQHFDVVMLKNPFAYQVLAVVRFFVLFIEEFLDFGDYTRDFLN